MERVEEVIISNNNVIDAIMPILMKASYLNRNYFNPRNREQVQTKSRVGEGLVFFSDRLHDISKSRWNQKEIELELMNVILFRTEIAIYHHITAEKMKDETIILIDLVSEQH